MTWELVNSLAINEPEIVLPKNFTSRVILSISNIAGYRPTWNWAGFFYQYLDIDPIGLVRLPEKIYCPILDPLLFSPQN